MLVRARNLLLPLLAATALLCSASSAMATASFDFVSSGGQFSIANNTLSFGNGLTISAASVDNVADPDLVGASILLDPIPLTGGLDALGGGIFRAGLAAGPTLQLQIFQAPADGGGLLATATYDPGEFIVLGASGILSGEIVSGVTDLVLTPLGTGYSAVLDALVASPLAIDFNVTLSAAGQDIAQRIDSGALVLGAVAGSAATFIPEPTIAVLMGVGLTGLIVGGRRRDRA